MTESERTRFNTFLVLNYDMYYNAWLCLVEPLKSQIYQTFLDFNLTGKFDKIVYAPPSVKLSKSEKLLSIWLRKNVKISYDCFLNLAPDMKKKVYKLYLQSPEGHKRFVNMGVKF